MGTECQGFHMESCHWWVDVQDHATHYEAVGTLGNLVHSSPEIKRKVLTEGILQPVINLLQCSCRESLREAALLVGQFAQCDSRGHIRRAGNRDVRSLPLLREPLSCRCVCLANSCLHPVQSRIFACTETVCMCVHQVLSSHSCSP